MFGRHRATQRLLECSIIALYLVSGHSEADWATIRRSMAWRGQGFESPELHRVMSQDIRETRARTGPGVFWSRASGCQPESSKRGREAVEHDRDESLGAFFGQWLLPEKAKQGPEVFGIEIASQLASAYSGVEQ